MPAQPGRAFHPDPSDREPEAVQQRQHLGEPVRCGGEGLDATAPAVAVEDRDREGVLVRVDPGHPVDVCHP